MNFHGGNIYEYKDKVIDFSSNINPLGVPVSFKLMLQNNIEEFTRYPDISYFQLRKAIAEYLGLKDINSIIPGNGAVELLYRAIGVSGKRSLLGFPPTFSEYSRAASFNGIDYKQIAVFDQGFQTVDIDRIIEKADADSVAIICNPNNPTGTLIEKEQMKALASGLQRKGSLLIIDEAFMEFTPGYPDNSMVSELHNFNNLLIVRAATKFFGMPGIRLGYAVTSNQKWLNAIKESLEPWNVNTAAVLAGCCVLKDYEYILKSEQWINSERDYLYEGLSSIDGIQVFKSAANFHLIKLQDKSMDAWKLKELMLKQGILIRTPDGFLNLDGQYVRLAVKDRNSNTLLLNHLTACLRK